LINYSIVLINLLFRGIALNFVDL